MSFRGAAVRAVSAGVVLLGAACGEDDRATAQSAQSASGSGGASSSGPGAGGDGATGGGPPTPVPPPRVLLFSKTTGFRHDSIEDGVLALTEIGQGRDWKVTATEDAAMFTGPTLADFDVVVWLSTSGDVLDEAQQAAFEEFLALGRGYVGVHSASDTEYDWPFYGGLVGAYFQAHPAIQPATLRVERTAHPATTGLASVAGSTWSRTDEWYAFTTNPRADVHVLLSMDESSYQPGTPMGDHPISWYHGYGGGRAFYTALGHTKESWAEPAFVEHVAGGIEWAGGADDPRVALVDFDEVAESGAWDPHEYRGSFSWEVTPAALLMHDAGGANQHLVRRGVTLDWSRPYAVEALFQIHGTGGSMTGNNSFCLNLNVDGAEGSLAPPSAWAMNLDISSSPPAGVMKHMGFVDGAFLEIGQTPVDWAYFDAEYLLRVDTQTDEAGRHAPGFITVTVLDQGIVRERFEVDYSAFPYQPTTDAVRLGVNTHGTDWTMRSLRVWYLDGPAF